MSLNHITNTEVGFFKSCKATKGGRNTPLMEILHDIRRGKWAKEVAALREIPSGSPGYDQLKRKLPCFMMSASTRNGGHKAADVGQHSGYLQIDVDGVGRGEAEALRDRLATDAHVSATWLSPSGSGVKAALRIAVSVEDHGRSFQAAQEHFHTAHNVQIDAKCRDVCRLCFVSADPDLRVNENARELPMETPWQGLEKTNRVGSIVQRDRETEKPSYRVTEVVGVWGGVAQAVQAALPTHSGNNHHYLFILARAVKALEVKDGQFNSDQLRKVFGDWFQRATRFLRPGQTKDQYFMEFLAAYGSAKFPLGAGTIEEAWSRAQETAMPSDILAFSEDHEIRLAIALCRELQIVHGDAPFFLSARTLAGLLKHESHSTSATWLKAFCVSKVLLEVHKGSGGRASRYRYLYDLT